MNEVCSLAQYEQIPSHRILNLAQFVSEILGEHVIHLPTNLDWLSANQIEALINSVENLPGQENACFEGLLYVGILGCFAELLKELGRTLGTLTKVTKHEKEEFLRVLDWHYLFSLLSEQLYVIDG
jgi:hypothetical protein